MLKEPTSRRSNNDDLFQDVKVPAFLDVYSICSQKKRHSSTGSEKLSKVSKHCSKSKSKRRALPKRSRRRKSKDKVKFPKRRTTVKSIMSRNSSSSHQQKGEKKDNCSVKDASNFKLPDVAKTDEIVRSSAGPTKQTNSSPHTNRPPALSLNYNNVSKLPFSSNCNREFKFSDKNEISLILRVNEAKQKVGDSSNVHSVVFPVIPKGPSAPQLAMQIVQALAWDTVRTIRRSGYAEGCDIVLVKPKGMSEAPSLLAMQNSKGDLTIPCDSLSNQTALSQILGLLHKSAAE